MQPTIDTSHRSPNFNDRPPGAVINALVIHTTEGPWDSDIRWLCNPASQVSTGYVISPTGTTYRLVDDAKRAWHAGVSSYLGRSDWNDFSIGIEVSHQKGGSYSAAQRRALTDLCRFLITQHPIRREFVVTHRQIAQPAGRKIDPTDWVDADFKLWADSLFAAPPSSSSYRVVHPTPISETPSALGPVALGGAAELQRGDVVQITDTNNGWGHLATGVGFAPMLALERLP